MNIEIRQDILVKSKLEIIDETVEAYRDPFNRAYGKGACHYYYNGKMCAVGRCMIDPRKEGIEEKSAPTLDNQFGLDNLLKEEYRGHPIELWNSLQHLHDSFYFFDANGYSSEGMKYIETLRKRYAD